MGGGGGKGHFSGTIGAKEWNPSSLGTMYAQAGNANVASDAGGKAAPAIKPWNREKAIQHLEGHAESQSQHKCAKYVRRAIEAGGISLDRSLNPTGEKQSAYGYGPVLEDAGFKPVPEGTPPQAGDVVIFPKTPDYEHGHAAMFNGEKWISDFEQDRMHSSKSAEDKKMPYTIYHRP